MRIVTLHALRDNPQREPVWGVLDDAGRLVRSGNAVAIGGPSRLVYRPDDPLQANGTAYQGWIETTSPLWMDGEEVL